jgi:LCP family protein required for cell wall assembly
MPTAACSTGGRLDVWLPSIGVARKDKPYRVYRSSRRARPSGVPVGGDVRDNGRGPHALHEPAPSPWEPLPGAEPPAPRERPERERPRRRTARRIVFWVGLVILLLVAVVAGWAAFGYLAFRGGVEEANERLGAEAASALTPQNGSLLTTPTNILVLGVDGGGAREEGGRSDAIVVVRTDPDRHRIALLSIPRDLRVEIPGHGFDKINAAYALGGPSLAIRTVERLLGRLPINHVAVVDFSSFPDVIDELGGVTVDVPQRIVSNRFDCPFKSRAECDRWDGWRFEKGPQEMSGRRALVYARIRENQLDPEENDITRGGRQQQVVQAVADEVVSFNGFVRLPFIGDDIVRPMATDLSATELLELGWVKFRASDDATLRCRLGGLPTELDGVFFLVASEENVEVVAMLTGEAAPQPPPPGQGLFAPGCTSG